MRACDRTKYIPPSVPASQTTQCGDPDDQTSLFTVGGRGGRDLIWLLNSINYAIQGTTFVKLGDQIIQKCPVVFLILYLNQPI
jgi:hypothetical protein